AIIPRTNPNNNVQEINKKHRIYEIYPAGKSHFYEYDDDGFTQAYLNKEWVYTCSESDAEKKAEVKILVHNAEGDFKGFEKEKSTEFWLNMTKKPKKIAVKVGKKNLKLKEVKSRAEFERSNNVYYYEGRPNLNAFSTKGSLFEQTEIIKNPQLLVKVEETDVTINPISLTIQGFEYAPVDRFKKSRGVLSAPSTV